MVVPKLLGIQTSLHTKPLTEPLRGNSSFQLIQDVRPALAKKLREHELSAALLSPLDYAKESSEYCIVPNVAVVSAEGGTIVRFREGVKKIRTLAVDPQFACEIILAKIILSEAFHIEPQIFPMHADAETMMQRADAALLVGDAAFGHQSENSIDVVEEWFELTGTPFVHAIWCGREDSLVAADMDVLRQAQAQGIAGIPDLLLNYDPSEREGVQDYLESFTYALEEQDRDGLAEFMKYLYYHGILPDVVDLNFFNTSGDLLSDISPN